jgi:hypothetical protein
MEVSPDVVI